MRDTSATPDFGKNFCILPWVHFNLHHSGRMLPCCRSEGRFSYGNVRGMSLDEVWNSADANRFREQFLAREAPAECAPCYKTEAAGGASHRIMMNRLWKHDMELLSKDARSRANFSRLQYLSLSLSNQCNFRCRTCCPQNSNSWSREAMWLYKEEHPSQPIVLDDRTLKLLDPLLPQLKLLYLAGGEPLIQKPHEDLLRRLLEVGNSDIILSYNTNFSNLGAEVRRLWTQFKKVQIGASLDGVGAQAEFLRKGTRWPVIENNFKTLRMECPQARFFIHATVSVMNAFHITEAVERWIQLKMIQWPDDLEINVLDFPDCLNINILDSKEREALRNHYEDFIARMQSTTPGPVFIVIRNLFHSILNRLSETPWIDQRVRFREFTRQLDELRAESFEALFPELRSLLHEDSSAS